MPTFNFYRKNKKKSYNKFRKKNYSKNRQQLLSVKTVETIAQKAAKDAARDHRVTLIRRTFYPHAPDFESGVILDGNGQAYNAFLTPGFKGIVSCMSNFRRLDNATNRIVVPISGNDPHTATDEVAEAREDQENNISPQLSQHGRRSAHQVKLTGCSMSIRAKVKTLFTIQNFEPDPLPADPSPYLLFGQCTLKYAIVAARWEGMDSLNNGLPIPNGQIGRFIKPKASQLLKWNVQGYSSQLDTEEELKVSGLKLKTLCRGEMKLRFNRDYLDDKTATVYAKFKKPILLGWRPSDMTGERADKWKIYCVMRSNIPEPAAGGAIYDPYKPQVQAVTKLYYHDV